MADHRRASASARHASARRASTSARRASVSARRASASARSCLHPPPPLHLRHIASEPPGRRQPTQAAGNQLMADGHGFLRPSSSAAPPQPSPVPAPGRRNRPQHRRAPPGHRHAQNHWFHASFAILAILAAVAMAPPISTPPADGPAPLPPAGERPSPPPPPPTGTSVADRQPPTTLLRHGMLDFQIGQQRRKELLLFFLIGQQQQLLPSLLPDLKIKRSMPELGGGGLAVGGGGGGDGHSPTGGVEMGGAMATAARMARTAKEV